MQWTKWRNVLERGWGKSMTNMYRKCVHAYIYSTLQDTNFLIRLVWAPCLSPLSAFGPKIAGTSCTVYGRSRRFFTDKKRRHGHWHCGVRSQHYFLKNLKITAKYFQNLEHPHKNFNPVDNESRTSFNKESSSIENVVKPQVFCLCENLREIDYIC